MVVLIERKKRGEALTASELQWICHGYLEGEIPDYQVAAWLMAVRWRGMTGAETLALTDALVGSGRTLEWPADQPVVDKHSTGGVGDKTSIVLVPLLAAAGITFVKMSGRGLGHTGGTIDKLEAIPGLETDLDLDRLRRQVERIGCALVSQNQSLAPADGALYALRDVTATVDSEPLIASSVMSKKLAAGARAIVLDVKFGRGAFMANEEEAEALAATMVAIGKGAGRKVRAVLSPMDEPLGQAVGNALEVREAIDVLHGGGPADVRELTLVLGSHLMVLIGCAATLGDARSALAQLLGSGVGAAKLEELIQVQGGDSRVVADPDLLPPAPHVEVFESPQDGWLERVDARLIAQAALELGAGRRRKGDAVDPRTGVRLVVKGGRRIAAGEPLAEMHAASEDASRAALETLSQAFRWSDCPVHPFPQAHRIIEG
ncbi:MAG: thymidine phosphorylase [Gemmatimonas sp.]|nr:thymidine phosphorylase [Gemmatimonas sp.]